MKKVLLLASVFVITVLTAILLFLLPASAASGTWGELAWTLNESTGELVISGSGDMDDLLSETPQAWHTHADRIKAVKIEDGVTSIGEGAFYDCINLTSVTIPSTVTSIDDAAFYLCDSLTNISLPSSVTSIGSKSFMECRSLVGMVLPDSVTSIGNYAFGNCASMTSIMIPNSVTSIGMGAFRGCTSLRSVTIPSTVKTIAYNLFRDCTALTEITLPNSITTIGACAVEGCTSLTNVNYWGTREQWDDMIIGNGNELILSTLQMMGESLEHDPPVNEDEDADGDKDDGCGSMISGGLGMVALITLAGTMLVSKKRKA